MPKLSSLISTAHAANAAYRQAVDCGADATILQRLGDAADSALAAVTAMHPSGITEVSVTVTDAIHDGYGWSANGCWVRRYSLWVSSGASPATISRAIKRAAGYSGVRGTVEDYGDSWRFKPYGQCVLIFADFN